MGKLATTIAKQCTRQQLSAVSFDSLLWSFVINYLEPMLGDYVVYHCWLGSVLSRKTFRHELNENILYKDNRVKTLFVPYRSQFDL